MWLRHYSYQNGKQQIVNQTSQVTLLSPIKNSLSSGHHHQMDRRQSSAAKGLTEEMRTEPSNLLRQPSLQNVGVWSKLHSDRCTAGLTTECGHVQKNSLGVPPLNFFSSSAFILFSKWLIERKRLLTFL